MRDETRHDLALPGCTPEPLMSYLKALGVLRLLSEQKDPDAQGCTDARGWWKNDVFYVRSTLLFRDADTDEAKRNAITRFFLDTYKPTPVVAPWNGGSGFYLKWDEKKGSFKSRKASDSVSKIESSAALRLQPYREQISAIKRALQSQAKLVNPEKDLSDIRSKGSREKWTKRKTDQEVKKFLDSQLLFSAGGTRYAISKVDKDELLSYTRSSLLNDEAIEWLDAAFVIRTGRKKNRIEAPLLGSGGNIGNSDFSARFMEMLSQCIALDETGGPSNESADLLRGALFGSPTSHLKSLAVDQFDPGRAGGANMHQGLEACARLNPWDYILMVEGALVLQGASSKRLDANSSASAFPFAVETTSAGFDSSGIDETRGEQWLPLWARAGTGAEVKALLAEGRSEVGGRSARNGVEFAQAAASLGVDRGIKQFVRVQYQARFGDNYLANAVGRVDVLRRQSVDLLRQIDAWLVAFRRAAGDENAPPRFRAALNRIDSSVFAFCKYGGKSLFQQILIALGLAERELALTEGKVGNSKTRPKPLVGLSPDWIDAANDNSFEFHIALALASIHDPERKTGPLRSNLEPVVVGRKNDGEWYANWAEKNRAVVWHAADLGTNVVKTLQRRIIDGQTAGSTSLPLSSRFRVPLATVAAFLAEEPNDQRIEQLIWGLMLINGKTTDRPEQQYSEALVPRAYALLKLLFLPGPFVIERRGDGERFARLLRLNEEGGLTICPEPAILHLIGGGRLGEACAIAMRRLRASGLDPMPSPIRARGVRDADWRELEGEVADREALRLAAALLIPISDVALNRLFHLVIRTDEIVEREA